MSINVKDMIDIWENKPIGYLKELSKNIKNKNKYIVSYVPYKKEYFEPIQVTVFAKDGNSALRKALNTRPVLDKKYDYETRVKIVK
jgi:hypothetical protein